MKTWGESSLLDSKIYNMSMEEAEQQDTAFHIAMETSKSGLPTVCYHSEMKHSYLHSRYDPAEEAAAFIHSLYQLEEYELAIFYGVGLGYHIEYVNKIYPNIQMIGVEPCEQVLPYIIQAGVISDSAVKALDSLFICNGHEDVYTAIEQRLSSLAKKSIIIPLPSYQRVFPQQYQAFYRRFGQYVGMNDAAKNTKKKHQKHWTINAMGNFDHIIHSGNMLSGCYKGFQGKPAILVSAGPSLDEEVELLRQIKQAGTAYIFSVGSAINTLVEYGAYPDAMVSIDPSDANKQVFQKLIDARIDFIPLIFGTCIGPGTLDSYSGPKIHVITDKDKISPYLLTIPEGGELPVVSDASSVAIVALEILHRLGCDPIVLVGQNMAYREAKYYASGIHGPAYDETIKRLEGNQQILFEVPSVTGGKVLSNTMLNQFRIDMENVIQKYSMTNIINCTVDGARIEGTTYERLDCVMKEKLIQQVVEEHWHARFVSVYEKKYLASPIAMLSTSTRQLTGILDEMQAALATMHTFITQEKEEAGAWLLQKFFDSYTQLIHNDCFNVLVYPMNFFECGLAVQAIKRNQNQENIKMQLKVIVEAFTGFVQSMSRDMGAITHWVETMHRNHCNA